MRRGAIPDLPDGGGRVFTKQDLMDAGEISAKTFDMLRKAARIKGPSHGALHWPFTTPDVLALIRTAESGRFSERGSPAAAGWRRLLDLNA